MLHANNRFLIQAIEATPLLDGRFRKMRVVNCDLATGTKRGCFSVVFWAEDVVEGKSVALKFYDVSPASLTDAYRLNAFRRESDILQSLLSSDRCLQLVAGLRPYSLPVDVPGVGLVYIPCQYFAVEWLDQQIDEYFLDQQRFDAVIKLRLFNEIVLAVEALHRHEIFHRDLKADNLRARGDNEFRPIVAIDLGTAARHDSAFVGVTYDHPVGAIGYAPPEAICGLAGNRRVAALSDVYALGCLLYELFNHDHFYYSVRLSNSQFDVRLLAMAQYVTEPGDDARLRQWQQALSTLGRGVMPVRLEGPASTLPVAIAPLLNDVVSRLTDVDYRKRERILPWVRQVVWASIKVLTNEGEYQRRLAKAREQRRIRLERVERRRLKSQLRLGVVTKC